MSIRYPYAGEGIGKMFWGTVGVFVCTGLALVPELSIIADIALIICGIIYLAGLYNAGHELKGCKAAFGYYVNPWGLRAVKGGANYSTRKNCRGINSSCFYWKIYYI